MGNLQASTIASQLQPIESYINDVTTLKFSHSLAGFCSFLPRFSLSSTRFAKVGRAELFGTPVLVKVFVVSNEIVLLEPYRQQLMYILKRLSDHPNCSPFTRIYITPRCVILCRQFAKYTLHNRLSTRPFLIDVERRWVVFQLLKALAQCHIAMVCHGDIKSENVLVSSSLWVQLADFACFKPTFLPEDNPSPFSFFFDTCRQRSCNLAPERFKISDDINYPPHFPNDKETISEGLTEAMDIFAMGCLLAELLGDGRRCLFTLAQAVDYSRMDDENEARRYVAKLLASVGVPPEFRTLLATMLERNPTRRKNKFLEMSVYTSELFPALFEEYLYEFLRSLRGKPDDIITKLFVERQNYLPRLQVDETNRECAVLFINYVTSNVRACRTLSAKMDAISLLHHFAEVSPSFIGDRIIPYLTHLVSDTFPQVRSESIHVLVKILEMHEPSVQEDCRLIIDYILPKLKTVTLDSSNHVKGVLAINLGRLAMIALRFMEEGFRKLREESSFMMDAAVVPPGQLADSNDLGDNGHVADLTELNECSEEFFENERLLIKNERKALHAVINELFVNLCGSDNEVRQCLFDRQNLDLLCQFSGVDQATDILMHMITVLNDKPDWRMRATFYASCPVVAHHLGQLRCGKLLPFLQQGLQDNQEYVVYECLRCIYILCDSELLVKRLVFKIMRDVAPFLVHPNLWLRVAVASILTVFQSTFDIADIYVKICPLVRLFFKQDLIVFTSPRIVLQATVEPIPRQIWDYVIGLPRIREFINLLENNQTLNRLGGLTLDAHSSTVGDTITATASAPESLAEMAVSATSTTTRSTAYAITDVESVRAKLVNLGMTAAVEEKLLALKSVLCSMNFIDRGTSSTCRGSRSPECVHLEQMSRVRRRIFNMISGECLVINADGTRSRDFFCDPLSFSATESTMRLNTTARTFYSNENSNMLTSRSLLEETMRHKREIFMEQCRIMVENEKTANSEDEVSGEGGRRRRHGHTYNPFTAPIDMRPASRVSASAAAISDDIDKLGVDDLFVKLVCTTHEHTDKIVGLTLHSDQNTFASCSQDGLVKLWSVDSLSGSSNTVPMAMSKHTLRHGRPFTACGYTPTTGQLVLASEDRVIQLWDQGANRILRTFITNEKDGAITSLQCKGNLIYGITHHSAVYAFDPRVSSVETRTRNALQPLWRGQLKDSYGLITSFCVDPTSQHWAFFTGSSATTRNMILWDLRFAGLEVASWSHSNAQAIAVNSWAMARGPGGRSTEVFVASSKEAELSLWDLTTRTRTDVLWCGASRPLTYLYNQVTTALTTSCVNPELVLTGDSEGALRCWNLRRTDRSAYLCGPNRKRARQPVEVGCLPKNALNRLSLKNALTATGNDASHVIDYTRKTCEGSLLRVHVENNKQLDVPASGDRPVQLLNPTDNHHDAITDLLSVWSDQIVSASRDGVIKLWKMT